jgi:hypothetical protein
MNPKEDSQAAKMKNSTSIIKHNLAELITRERKSLFLGTLLSNNSLRKGKEVC